MAKGWAGRRRQSSLGYRFVGSPDETLERIVRAMDAGTMGTNELMTARVMMGTKQPTGPLAQARVKAAIQALLSDERGTGRYLIQLPDRPGPFVVGVRDLLPDLPSDCNTALEARDAIWALVEQGIIGLLDVAEVP
jgi:hypothetical protein